ncbi:hypothetical protein FCV25MIE_31623 [Fagus crenata]
MISGKLDADGCLGLLPIAVIIALKPLGITPTSCCCNGGYVGINLGPKAQALTGPVHYNSRKKAFSLDGTGPNVWSKWVLKTLLVSGLGPCSVLPNATFSRVRVKV